MIAAPASSAAVKSSAEPTRVRGAGRARGGEGEQCEPRSLDAGRGRRSSPGPTRAARDRRRAERTRDAPGRPPGTARRGPPPTRTPIGTTREPRPGGGGKLDRHRDEPRVVQRAHEDAAHERGNAGARGDDGADRGDRDRREAGGGAPGRRARRSTPVRADASTPTTRSAPTTYDRAPQQPPRLPAVGEEHRRCRAPPALPTSTARPLMRARRDPRRRATPRSRTRRRSAFVRRIAGRERTRDDIGDARVARSQPRDVGQ